MLEISLLFLRSWYDSTAVLSLSRLKLEPLCCWRRLWEMDAHCLQICCAREQHLHRQVGHTGSAASINGIIAPVVVFLLPKGDVIDNKLKCPACRMEIRSRAFPVWSQYRERVYKLMSHHCVRLVYKPAGRGESQGEQDTERNPKQEKTRQLLTPVRLAEIGRTGRTHKSYSFHNFMNKLLMRVLFPALSSTCFKAKVPCTEF